MLYLASGGLCDAVQFRLHKGAGRRFGRRSERIVDPFLPEMAVSLTVNSKTQKCGVCNALETLLVHRDIAAEFLPKVAAALRAKNVELRGCEETRGILTDAIPATEEDWETEYLDLIISIKIVGSLEDAVSQHQPIRLAPH